MILILLILLIVAVDVWAIKDLLNTNINSNLKILFILLVLFIPIIGVSIYYFVK